MSDGYSTETEQEILSNLGDIDNGEPDTSDQTTTSEEAPIQSQGAEPTSEGHSEDSGKEQVASEQGDAGAAEEDGREKQAVESVEDAPEGASGFLRSNSKGDLLDDRGRLVAKAGRERRFYEDKERHRRHAEQITSRNADLERYINSIQVLNGQPQKLGLNAQQAELGLTLVSQWMQNPGETIKYILSEYAKAGGDVKQLLGDTGVSEINTNAVKGMIDEAVRPLTDRQRQEQEDAELTRTSKETRTNFLNTYPDAVVHEDAIARLMTRQEIVDPERAYLLLKTWALENKFDFNKPLDAQVRVRQSGQTETQQPASSAPIVNGRGAVNGAAPVNTAGSSVNDSYESIIRAAMSEAGM